MAARFLLVCVGALALVLPCAGASDSVDALAAMVEMDAATVGTVNLEPAFVDAVPQTSFDPRMSPELSEKNRDQVTVGFQLAVEKLRDVAECRELFTDLGADGISMLHKVWFFPMGSREALPNMCRGAVAYTMVGGGPTWLCHEFWRLTDKRAAMTIIHEALHHAGLTEWPKDPDGMKSTAINRMVMKRCGL